MAFPFRRSKGAKLAIEPWGDSYESPVVGPFAMLNAIGRLAFIKAAVVSGLIASLLLNILLVWGVVNNMNTRVFVADGSRFGCEVLPVKTE